MGSKYWEQYSNKINGIITEIGNNGISSYQVGSVPNRIAIDASGNVWVTNYHDGTVSELTSTGLLLGTYTVNSTWNTAGIAIDSLGHIWVSGYNANTLSELDSNNGWLLNSTIIGGSLVGIYNVGRFPMGIVVDKYGNIWVTNSADNTVTELIGITNGPQYWPYQGPISPGGGNF